MPLFRRPSKDPLWKDEFSIFTADERYVSRRQLTKFLTLTSLGMFAGNLWILIRSWLYREPAYPLRKVLSDDELPAGAGYLVVVIMPIRDDIFAPDQRLTIVSRFRRLVGGRFTLVFCEPGRIPEFAVDPARSTIELG